MNYSEKLESLFQKNGVTQEEAADFYDSLPAYPIENIYGRWMGREMATGHPFDGVLTATEWYGKYFEDSENSYPLMYQKRNKKFFFVNPNCLPLEIIQSLPRSFISFLFPLLNPFTRTKKSSSILRNIEYRNHTPLAMIYDEKPVIDYFKMVDETTIFAVSDMKWNPSILQFFALYKKEDI